MDTNKFKNSSGAYLLRGLFYETTGADKTGVIYTLKDEDHEGYPSLKRLYMEVGDPTEYHFAINHLAGVEHWDRLCESTWFKPYIEQWRRELELRYRAEALNRIIEESKKETSAARFQANKFILDKGWAPSKKDSVGRPSKEAIKQKAIELYEDDKRLQGDYDRILGRAN